MQLCFHLQRYVHHRNLFQKTPRALEIHLVNLTAQNEAYTSHYANLASEYGNLVSKNEAYRSHPINHQILQMNPMISTLVNSLAKNKSIL